MPGPKNPNPIIRRDEATLVKDRVRPPRRFKVLFHNDDFTPMEFVVKVLEDLFHKTGAEATRIMLQVHRSGIGVAGVYTAEIAETKARRAVQAARDAGYPLLVTTEPE